MSTVCFKPGDILTYSEYFGDARFVKITRTTAKTVFGRFLTAKIVSDYGGGQNGFVIPNADEFRSGEFRIGMIHDDYIWDGKHKAYASKWNGEPSHFYSD